jgi:glutathione S-transferase
MCLDMPKLKLTYFDFHGGRGEPARLALSIGGVPFEDNRIKGSDWPAMKGSTPFGGLPVLEVDGQEVAQSNGINRYVGKLSKLYPDDALQAAFADEAMDGVEEFYAQLSPTFSMDDAAKKARREELSKGALATVLTNLGKRLTAHGNRYFADGRMTIADLKVYGLLRHLKSGVLDHIPADLPDRVAPNLVEHFQRIKADPGVAAYYARHQ